MKGSTFTETSISLSSDDITAIDERNAFDKALKGKHLHEITDFKPLLRSISNIGKQADVSFTAQWLNEMFGKRP